MARGPEKEDSVYDFLYVDARRIALFNSQFTSYGHLTSLTRTASDTKSSSGGVNAGVAKMGGGANSQTGQSRQFDTQWVAPLTFLDEADRREMLHRGIEGARIGKLVLIAGALEIRDLTIIKRTFALPSMRAEMQAQRPPDMDQGIRKQRRRDRRDAGTNAASPAPIEGPASFAFDFLGELPHALHATLRADGVQIWGSLREDGVVGTVSDLFLKHGVSVSGVWNMVGILDAFPEEGSQTPSPEAAAEEFQKANTAVPQDPISTMFTLATKGMGGLIDGIAPLARLLLGRPTRAYGITPLLIFREVSG